MYRPGIYVGQFVDSHLHLIGDCVNQFLTASLFVGSYRVDRCDDRKFQIQIELVTKPRNVQYGLLLGDLRERFEIVLRQCHLSK